MINAPKEVKKGELKPRCIESVGNHALGGVIEHDPPVY